MRASGDSEYVFAAATLPSPLGLASSSVRLNLSFFPSCNLEDSKQTTNRGQTCGRSLLCGVKRHQHRY